MDLEKFWLISENTTDDTYYYMGYYESGIPVFSLAIADAVHIASFVSAKGLYEILNRIIPCEIILVENNTISKVYPTYGH